MERVTEITIILENHAGSLARVAETLGERQINVLGFTLTNSLDYGALRMIVSAPTEALHLFGEHNLLAIETQVFMLQLRNEPGALMGLAEALAEAGVNIEYAYGSAGPATSEPTTLFVRVSDEERALAVFERLEAVE